MQHSLSRATQHVVRHAAQLDSLSPLGVLGRGYSLTTALIDGRLIRRADSLSVGQQIATRFEAGRAITRVEQIEP